MKYFATLLLGLLIGAGVMYLRSSGTGSPQVRPAPAQPVWTIISARAGESDRAWKLNTVTGEVRFCLVSALQVPGCVKVREADSLADLANLNSQSGP
jgi:hypothetical protein